MAIVLSPYAIATNSGDLSRTPAVNTERTKWKWKHVNIGSLLPLLKNWNYISVFDAHTHIHTSVQYYCKCAHFGCWRNHSMNSLVNFGHVYMVSRFTELPLLNERIDRIQNKYISLHRDELSPSTKENLSTSHIGPVLKCFIIL